MEPYFTSRESQTLSATAALIVTVVRLLSEKDQTLPVLLAAEIERQVRLREAADEPTAAAVLAGFLQELRSS